MLVVAAVLAVVLAGASAYLFQQESVRVSHIEMRGADESLADLVRESLAGTYLGLIPRNSIFFIPESDIRARLLAGIPGIAAVSVSRTGFTSIALTVDYRVSMAQWCGLAPTEGVEEYCYDFDANGFIFTAHASTTRTLHPFALYAPLVGNVEEPLRAIIARAQDLPSVFDFARELKTFGAPVERIVIRNDEVDNLFAHGTRVTYILGREHEAFTALVSARENIHLSDGSIEYVDLRFDGRVYLKRR